MRPRLALFVFCATLAVGVAAGVAGGQGSGGPGSPAVSPAAQLERELGPGVEVASHRETGAVRFVGTEPGRPIPRDPRLGPQPDQALAALAFADAHGEAFGLDPRSAALRVASTTGGPRGHAAVRLQQEIGNVPVMAGELVVAVDRGGDVLSAAGELEPDPVDTSAEIGAGEARRVALESDAKGRAGGVAALRASDPQLAIYDSRLLGGPGLGVPALVWQTEVSSPADPARNALVLVDAKLGVVAETIGLTETAKDRRVCDAENSAGRYPCEAPYEREEGDPAVGDEDIDSAYEFAGDTYDFYSERFGRDSLDGEGLPLLSTVRYCPEAKECPYENAFWDGEQMVYGEGFAAADDVVGHELSHGFTQFTSNLFYWYQSGAINESMSDVFGELVDLTNSAGTDTSATRWLLGEDIPKIGAIRNMKNPPAFNDPDKMTSSLYVADPNQADNGGVHTNSGVNNKAAYLITDGESFNGKTVTGIGIDKAARVYYEADAGLLTSGSDYADLYDALQQACVNAIGGKEGIAAADCEEVTDAVDATEMNQQPLNGPAPEAPVCGAEEEPVDIFYDDLETPGSGNWTHTSLSGTDGWYYPQNPNLFEWFDATYATSGKTNFWGYDRPTTSDSAITQTNDVTIPSGTVYLRFDHSYAFEDGSKPVRRYDGGRLEYSVNGGSSWQDADPLFTHNGYNGTIESKYGNPLGGLAAFTAESNGYISSRVDLSSLAGEEVRFRFRIGTDEIVDDYGWFIDDIRIYECEEAEPPPDETPPETTIETGPDGATSDNTPTFSFSANEEPVTFQCRLDAEAFALCSSPHTTAELADGAHTFEVRATDAAENTDPTPAKREFTVDTEAPAAPTGLATDPASPANDNEPLVSGETEAGSTVRLYRSNNCSGPVEDEGGAAEFESPGLQAEVAVDATAQFSATAEDTAGNLSPCSAAVEYVEDSTPPTNPSLESPSHTVESPSSDTTVDVTFSGATDSLSGVDGFSYAWDTSPTTTPDTTKEAEESATGTTSPPLADGSSHYFHLRTRDNAGNWSAAVHLGPFTVDTEAPAAPTGLATDPASPANDNEPLVSGEAEAASTVRLYQSNDCSGSIEDEGGAEEFESPGLQAEVAADATAQFSTTAEDAAGNVSPCSSAVEYVEDSTAPQTSIASTPDALTNLDAATFEFSGEDPGGSGVASFECRLDSSEEAAWAPCTSPKPYASLADGAHSFEVRAIDAAENRDATPASHAWTVDTEAPAAPTGLATDPASPANDNEPLVSGEAEAGSTVRLYQSNDCSGPVEDEGGAEEFESSGLQATVPDSTTVQFSAEAEDLAGNVSACSDSVEYVEDSEPPVEEPPAEEPPSEEPPAEEPPEETPEESLPPEEGTVVEPVLPALQLEPIEPDETPPGAILLAPRRQVSGRAIAVRVRCDEPCTVIANGTVVVWRGGGANASARARHRRRGVRIGLKKVIRILAADSTATLRLRPRNRRAPRLLRRLARRGWKARAVIRVRYVDGAGNSTAERMELALVAQPRN